MRNGRTSLDKIKAFAGKQRYIADALGITQDHVSRIATGKSPVPVYMDAVAELLEALPPKDWPERWKR